jgi:hypothetical protein
MTQPESHAELGIAQLAASAFTVSMRQARETSTEPRFDVIRPDATEDRIATHEVAAGAAWLRSATDLRDRLTTAIDGKPA